MKLGFHYHIPIAEINARYYTISAIGLFIDSIADQTESLHVVYYSPTDAEMTSMNYQIQSANIIYYHLGIHNSAPKRLLRMHQSIAVINRVSNLTDFFILRAPTPLSLALPFIRNKHKVILYLVGNYVKNSTDLIFNPLKNMLIRALSYSVEFANKRHIRNRLYLTNSQEIINDHKGWARGILIKTTTLKQNDFYPKAFKYTDDRALKLLFVGRIDKSKGVFEILQAARLLSKEGITVEIHLAGMPEKGNETILSELQYLAEQDGAVITIIFHGQLNNGTELNALYRSCDLFIIASISEGFPRTIWEAMANSLPVIATSVGSIPYFLTDDTNVMLLKNRQPESIAAKIKFAIQHQQVINRQVQQAYALVQELTLEKQAALLVQTLNGKVI